MNTNNKITKKRNYLPPIVDKIILDNEISLALESSPPDGPGEVYNNAPKFLNSNPFKNDIG